MKEVYQVELAASNALETAINTLMAAPYNSNEDVGRLMPQVVTRDMAKKLLIRAALRKDRQGFPQGTRAVTSTGYGTLV